MIGDTAEEDPTDDQTPDGAWQWLIDDERGSIDSGHEDAIRVDPEKTPCGENKRQNVANQGDARVHTVGATGVDH